MPQKSGYQRQMAGKDGDAVFFGECVKIEQLRHDAEGTRGEVSHDVHRDHVVGHENDVLAERKLNEVFKG